MFFLAKWGVNFLQESQRGVACRPWQWAMKWHGGEGKSACKILLAIQSINVGLRRIGGWDKFPTSVQVYCSENSISTAAMENMYFFQRWTHVPLLPSVKGLTWSRSNMLRYIFSNALTPKRVGFQISQSTKILHVEMEDAANITGRGKESSITRRLLSKWVSKDL